MPDKLGTRLERVRKLRGLSMAQTAAQAGISAAYVQKLERDEVVAPSPHKLRALAAVLEVSYHDLMRLAGYATGESEATEVAEGEASVRVLAQALQAEDLSAEELEELADYLALRRRQREREAGDR
jgi:transcriptional regulator with XRE-family HTH domain